MCGHHASACPLFSPAVPAEKLEEFEVPEEERDFKGAPDDRKGLLEFRQAMRVRR